MDGLRRTEKDGCGQRKVDLLDYTTLLRTTSDGGGQGFGGLPIRHGLHLDPPTSTSPAIPVLVRWVAPAKVAANRTSV